MSFEAHCKHNCTYIWNAFLITKPKCESHFWPHPMRKHQILSLDRREAGNVCGWLGGCGRRIPVGWMNSGLKDKVLDIWAVDLCEQKASSLRVLQVCRTDRIRYAIVNIWWSHQFYRNFDSQRANWNASWRCHGQRLARTLTWTCPRPLAGSHCAFVSADIWHDYVHLLWEPQFACQGRESGGVAAVVWAMLSGCTSKPSTPKRRKKTLIYQRFVAFSWLVCFLLDSVALCFPPGFPSHFLIRVFPATHTHTHTESHWVCGCFGFSSVELG